MSATIEDIEKGYTFIVDENLNLQDVEKITNQDTSIVIETSSINKSDYTTATIKAKITVGEEITSIKVREEEIEIPEKVEENGKLVYEIEKQVEKNGNYKIKAETTSGKANYKIQKVSDLSEDMEIRTAEELAWFRDRVNKGATYKERTINLMNDIDLRSVCNSEKTWDSIGGYNYNKEEKYNKFSGTFKGNNKTIDYLYIENQEDLSQGLFGYTDDATIMGVIIGEHSSINAKEIVGGIVGYAYNTTILNCGNNGGISGSEDCIGGIIGALEVGNIIGCYNKGKIIGAANVGGICGDTMVEITKNKNGKCVIQYSYNAGTIELKEVNSSASVGGIVGYLEGYSTVKNCYNKGNIIGNTGIYIGGCVGHSRAKSYTSIIENKFTTEENAAAQINYTCNIGAVSSNGINGVGGICGMNNQYCIVKNNYILNNLEIKKDTTRATKDVGETNDYLGKYVGRAYINTKTYIDANGEITNIAKIENETGDITNTVYYIVNEMSSNNSEYWDKGNPTEPKLKWEL